jgi:hypothetical protein
MAASDWKRAAPHWTRFAVGFWNKYKPVFPWSGDMYAFNMALAVVGLRHTQV